MLTSNAPNQGLLRSISFLLLALALTALTAQAQPQKKITAHGADDETPALQEYKGVSIGMTADDVRKKLGNPSDKGEEQDFYVFSDNETAQVLYDKTRKVMAISFDYTSAAREVPTVKNIFGTDVEPKPDGSIYKMVRYPKAGYWLSYNRTAGPTPLTSITFQKIER
jgi:outer membrane protein assembly factor BamE (lipoprotein component of BamABCDE complex)